jgi:ribosomal-protein-alanine N-acetyltransferase
MRTKDLRGVLRIEAEVFPQPWSHRLFVEELAQRKSRAYRAAWIGTDIAVDPAWQRRGLGSLILLDMTRVALELGSRHLTLEVRVANQPAIGLYRRFGMAPVGVRPNYYPETGEDALIMWVRDIDSETYARRLDAIEASLPADLALTSRR